MNLITDPTDQIIPWCSHLFLDTENETDVNPENFILFADSDVTSLVNWFQGLSNLDYRQRQYTLSLVIGCYVDKEALVTIRGRHESSQMQSMTASTTITV